MVGGHKVEHVRLQVDSPADAAEFYEGSLGMTIVERQNGTIYLGCGLDDRYDLALSAGKPGVEHVAYRTETSEALATAERRLQNSDIETRRTDGEEPGQERGLLVRLPSGLGVELVDVADKEYNLTYDSSHPSRGGLAPMDLNHYNYHAPDVERDTSFLQEYLDFSASAVIDDGKTGAFLRRGDKHHDLAVFDHANGPPDRASHHHTGLTVSSAEHMVGLLDRLTDRGIHVEFGLGRHFGGNNLFAYVRAPDGHRLEFVTGMTELDDDTPTQYVDDVEQAVSAWHGGTITIPESWGECTGLARRSVE